MKISAFAAIYTIAAKNRAQNSLLSEKLGIFVKNLVFRKKSICLKNMFFERGREK